MGNTAEYIDFRDRLRRELAYETPPGPARWRFGGFGALRTLCFHARVLWGYRHARQLIRQGRFDLDEYALRSVFNLRVAEDAGGQVKVTGLEHVARAEGPVVIVGNHMSSLETIMLSGFLLPFKDVAFVVKDALLRHVIFGPIMRAVKMIPVSRTNPRDDLKRVLTQGAALLQSGVSVVIFPQATRATVFDPAQFNSLGVKLAARAGVPVVPMALRTDFWANGRLIKDLGPICPDRPIRVAFDAPRLVTGTGRETHEAIVGFITQQLHAWGLQTKETSHDGA
jgi:1-acyl-sn-glycerol-3-phosphate acyltransferase